MHLRGMKIRLRPFEIIAAVVVTALKATGIVLVLLLGDDAVPDAVLWWMIADAAALGVLTFVLALAMRLFASRLQTQIAKSSRELRTVGAGVQSSREKQARHEYRHALQLSELRREVAEVRSDTEYIASGRRGSERAGHGPLRVLMVTSNGAGLGHLTRCLALASEFPGDWDVDILTLSTGWRKVSPGRARLHYFPSREHLGLPQHEWHRRFARAFAQKLEDSTPDVIFFDGTAVYRAIHEAARQRLIPFIWIVRGGWKPGIENEQTKQPERIADGLLLPGDYAIGPETAPVATDVLPTLRTPPLVYLPHLLSGAEARRELALPEGKRYVLIQLGAGNVDDIGEKLSTAVAAVDALGPNWQPVVVDSPISTSATELPQRVARISAYPLSKFYRAFEFVVVAAGYNTVQEVIALGVPALMVPNLETLTDDQRRRAETAADRGLAFVAATVDEIGPGVAKLADPVQRSRVARVLAEVAVEPGAAGVADWVEGIVADARLVNHVRAAIPAVGGSAHAHGIADVPGPEMER